MTAVVAEGVYPPQEDSLLLIEALERSGAVRGRRVVAIAAARLGAQVVTGSTVESDRFMVAICTCRRSKTYPLCDTSHRRVRRSTKRSE